MGKRFVTVQLLGTKSLEMFYLEITLKLYLKIMSSLDVPWIRAICSKDVYFAFLAFPKIVQLSKSAMSINWGGTGMC